MNVLITYIEHEAKEHNKTLDYVKKVVSRDCYFTLCERSCLTRALVKNKDLVIAVGGDGTFLRTSHFVEDEIMLGVNSDPKNKIGFLMSATKKDFQEKFQNILSKKYKIMKLNRIQGMVGKTKTEPALNELFFGRGESYQTARYEIKIKNMKESQKSSGVIIATAAGSNAWIKNVNGKVFPITSKKLQYGVREPCEKFKLRGGLLTEKDIKITAKVDSLVVVDSTGKEHYLKPNQTLSIVKARQLNVIK